MKYPTITINSKPLKFSFVCKHKIFHIRNFIIIQTRSMFQYEIKISLLYHTPMLNSEQKSFRQLNNILTSLYFITKTFLCPTLKNALTHLTTIIYQKFNIVSMLLFSYHLNAPMSDTEQMFRHLCQLNAPTSNQHISVVSPKYSSVQH